MKKDSGQIIQAFPIQSNTYVGTASGLDVEGFDIVHCNEDNTLTFEFGVEGTVVVNATAGQDFAIANNCKYLTSSAEVIVS